MKQTKAQKKTPEDAEGMPGSKLFPRSILGESRSKFLLEASQLVGALGTAQLSLEPTRAGLRAAVPVGLVLRSIDQGYGAGRSGA